MRKLCPTDREDALDTVLEVPIPKEMYSGPITGMRSWLKSQMFDKASEADASAGPSPASGPARPQLAARNAELQLLLKLGAPLIPCPVPHDRAFSRSIRDSSFQASTAMYIIQQYIAATGGQAALQSVESMYAVGKIHMSASEFQTGMEDEGTRQKGNSEYGAYVLWQKNPEFWYFDFIMAGCKLTHGSNGQVAWKQSSIEKSHVTPGPPRPLRRSLQGLDPRATANLFSDAMCVGEKNIKGDMCFILKLDTSPATLRARCTPSLDMIHHTIWGYFSQRTGLLIQLEDSQLLSMKSNRARRAGAENSIFWETSMESIIEDYRWSLLCDNIMAMMCCRYINGVNIAHAGRTTSTMLRYGEGSVNHKLRMIEEWLVDEADFNLWGLTPEYFLPPSDLWHNEEDA
ncbi:DUF620 family protein (DUF620) [Rhynchospora pubera]|uniref:DUF620 family protein (DUF620) n=1 Tax=Rhynchospora pubera TaxID=906938 RepID=A0AAV8FLM5_9POAL|nr:DUF620 family protein (DUF620) [Rhynchospora pubera]